MLCNANHIIMTKCEIILGCLLAPGSCIKWLLMSFYSGGMHKPQKYTKSNKDNHGSAGFKKLKTLEKLQSYSQTDGLDIYLF